MIIIYVFSSGFAAYPKIKNPPSKETSTWGELLQGKSICVMTGWLRVQCSAPCRYAITLMQGVWGYRENLVLPHKEWASAQDPVTGYLRISALINTVADWCWQFEQPLYCNDQISFKPKSQSFSQWEYTKFKIYMSHTKKVPTEVFSSVCLHGFCSGVIINNTGAAGDLKQTP